MLFGRHCGSLTLDLGEEVFVCVVAREVETRVVASSGAVVVVKCGESLERKGVDEEQGLAVAESD